MDKLKLAEQTLIDDEYPEFKTGDTVVVHYRVREGDKERIQKFEGLVISRRGSGANQTFMVRKISAGNIGVERIFPLHSPFIAKIELKRQGDIKRSKLYYLRDRQGKSARIKEKDQNRDEVRELNREAEAKAAAKEEDQNADEEE
jgi:large subunit ribosomal protein L19